VRIRGCRSLYAFGEKKKLFKKKTMRKEIEKDRRYPPQQALEHGKGKEKLGVKKSQGKKERETWSILLENRQKTLWSSERRKHRGRKKKMHALTLISGGPF